MGNDTDSILSLMGRRHFSKGNPQRILQVRQQLRLTQTEFGELLGVRRNTVARWERGDLIPPKVAELAAEHLLTIHQPKKGGTT